MAEEKKLLTEKDVKKSWLTYYFFAETGISYERLQALGFTMSLIPIFRKLYEKKEDFTAALKRHMFFYNTEAVFGSVINGIVIAMEEQKAQGAPIEDEAITSIKTGLMGPMAGVGDALDWATFKPIIFALGATLAASGNPLGAFVLLLLPIVQVIIGTNFAAFGYRAGHTSVKTILGSGMLKQILTAASAMGIFMMGALSSTYVSLSTPLTFSFGEGNDPWVIQNILDGVVPGLLPLGAVLGVYWWLSKKNQNIALIMLIILAVSLVGAFFGIF